MAIATSCDLTLSLSKVEDLSGDGGPRRTISIHFIVCICPLTFATFDRESTCYVWKTNYCGDSTRGVDICVGCRSFFSFFFLLNYAQTPARLRVSGTDQRRALLINNAVCARRCVAVRFNIALCNNRSRAPRIVHATGHLALPRPVRGFEIRMPDVGRARPQALLMWHWRREKQTRNASSAPPPCPLRKKMCTANYAL